MAYILTADRQITAYMLQSKALNATNRRAMLSQGAHRSGFRILTRVVGPGWSSYCDRNTRPPRSVNLLGGVLSESPQIDLAGLVQTADQLAEQIARDRQRLDSLNATVELLKDDPMPPTPRPGPKLKTLKLPAGMGREQPTAIPAVSPEPDPPVQDRAVDNMQALDVDFKGAKNMLERLRRIGRAAEGHYLSLGLMAHYLARTRTARGSIRSLRTYIRTCIARHPEHFERVGNGLYLYHDTPRSRSAWMQDGYVTVDPDHRLDGHP